MTLGELLLDVSHKTGMRIDAGSEERTDLIRWANRGRDRVLLMTGVTASPSTVTFPAGTNRVTLPTGALAILNRQVSGSNGELLLQVDYQTVLDYQRQNPAAGARVISLIGDDLVVAATPTSDLVINVDIIPRPTDMTADANDPASSTYGGIPSEYHEAIGYWMIAQAMERLKDYGDPAIDSARRLFEAEVRQVRGWARRRGGRTLAPARVGYPGNRLANHDNSTYRSNG